MWEWNSRKCGKDPWDNYLDLKKIYTSVKVEVFIKSHSTLPLSMYIYIYRVSDSWKFADYYIEYYINVFMYSDATVPYITSRLQNILLIEDHLSQIPQVWTLEC